MTDGALKGASLRKSEFPRDVLLEQLTDEWGFYIRSRQQIERFSSAFQAIEVHDSGPFGKLFRLDGHFMTSEKDEFSITKTSFTLLR